MKKILTFLALISISLSVCAQTIEGGVSFDWISKTQIQRDENIKQIHDILFSGETVKKYPKNELKKMYEPFLKDNNHLKNYEEIANGKTEDEKCKYSGFYWKNILVVYGIQYKNDLTHNYYYDAMGNLQFVDTFSPNYPNFPYYSYQYRINGQLVGKFYFLSAYDQYIYSPEGKFMGRWYKENMYNRNAKVIMTRTNW